MLDRLRTYRASFGTLVAQLFFIAAGVYLGNQADNWKEERAHRELVRSTLQNFRADIASNRAAIARVMPYHVALRRALVAPDSGLLARPAKSWDEFRGRLHFAGTRTVGYADAAWDLALATQALPLIEPRLRFELAELYRGQRFVTELQSQFMATAFTPQTFSQPSPQPLAVAMAAYLGDVTIAEPTLLRHYDRLLPRLDSLIVRGER